MSAMQKIFGMFQRTATPVLGVSNDLQGTPTMQAASGSLAPASTAQAPATAPVSPLEKHKDIWQPPKQTEKEDSTPLVADPKAIMEAASKVDFSKILDKEALAKVQAGGDDAVQALVGLLNQTAQAVYGQSAIAANKIVEQAVSQAEQKFAGKVPSLVNQQAAAAKLLTANKALANPAVAPIVNMIQSQLAAHYPNATSDELASMAQELMKGAAEVFNPAEVKEVKAKDNKPDPDDWSDYIKT